MITESIMSITLPCQDEIYSHIHTRPTFRISSILFDLGPYHLSRLPRDKISRAVLQFLLEDSIEVVGGHGQSTISL